MVSGSFSCLVAGIENWVLNWELELALDWIGIDDWDSSTVDLVVVLSMFV